MAGYILFFLVTLGFVYLTDIPSLIFLFVLYGLVWAVVNTVPKALISDLSGTMKGTAHGFYQFMIGIISIVGGLIAGALWDLGPEIMFTYMSVVALLSIVLLTFVRE
jgi:MFS family permease